jgi:hypothetical protein
VKPRVVISTRVKPRIIRALRLLAKANEFTLSGYIEAILESHVQILSTTSWITKELDDMAKKSSAHPGFKNVAKGMAAKQGISQAEASAELAASTRKASPAAKKANPFLKRVKGK